MEQEANDIEPLSLGKALYESLAVGVIQLASAVPDSGVVLSAAGAAVFLAYQNYNLDQAVQRLRQRIATIDRDKLDQDFIRSNQFKDIVVQVAEAAMKTSSELRCDALVQISCGCFTKPSSTYINKQALIRLVAQMSDEEMQALYVIQEEERKFFSGDQTDKTSPMVQVAVIANQLGWDYLNTLIACQGLEQLNLVYNAEIRGGGFGKLGDSLPGDRVFRGTELGQRLVDFAQGRTWHY